MPCRSSRKKSPPEVGNYCFSSLRKVFGVLAHPASLAQASPPLRCSGEGAAGTAAGRTSPPAAGQTAAGRSWARLVLKVTGISAPAFRNRTVSQQQQQLQFYFANRARGRPAPPALSCSRQAELACCNSFTRAKRYFQTPEWKMTRSSSKIQYLIMF